MLADFLLFLGTLLLTNSGLSAGDCVSQQANDCTSGFMGLDRIEAAVKGSHMSIDHVLGDLVSYPTLNEQVIVPNINFTCDGSILSWTFGAQWDNDSQAYTELQIWRSSGDGSYTKVGSTTIMLEEESSPQVYQNTLSSPLPFQAGDILGFFQHSMSAHLQYEDVGSGHPLHFAIQDSPSNQFNVANSFLLQGMRVLINVETDPAGCDCGFMSVERMRIVLGLETVGFRSVFHSRQQIFPSIKFTCEGFITMWVIGAGWLNNGNSYPQLQVWRNIVNDVYYKISGTFINITMRNPSNIYEYDAFSPIPVQEGDILGVFTPDVDTSKAGLWSERDRGPLVYYTTTGESATESPFDLQAMSSVSSQTYHPLVTLEVLPQSSLSSSPLTSLQPELVATPPVTAAQLTTTLTASATPPIQDDATINNVFLFVGVGVAGILLVLITTIAVTTTVLVCLRKKKKVNMTENVTYQFGTSEGRLSYNPMYAAINDHSLTSDDQEYMYIPTEVSASSEARTHTGPSTANAQACNIPNEIAMSTNEAYGNPTTAHGVHHIPTSTNAAYNIATSINLFAAPDATTPTNQPHEAVEYEGRNDSPTYDYIDSHECDSK